MVRSSWNKVWVLILINNVNPAAVIREIDHFKRDTLKRRLFNPN